MPKRKGVVFVGPVLMHTTKEAFEERRKKKLPQRGRALRGADGYQPLAMHAHERLSVIRDLIKRGYSVAVPVQDFDLRSPKIRTFTNAAKKAGAKVVTSNLDFSPREGGGLFGFGEETNSATATWVADAQRFMNGKVYTPNPYETTLHLRGANVHHPIVRSSAGESGAIVGHGRVLLVTKKIKREDINQLKRDGHRVYVMPTFSSISTRHYRSDGFIYNKEFDKFIPKDPNDTRFMAPGRTIYKHTYNEEAHLDIRINIIERAKLIIVTPPYYKKNRALIQQIAKENGLRVGVVSGAALLPTNILWLPDGKVMINKSPQLKQLLEKFGLKEEKDFIVSSKEIKYNRFLGGGMGCFATGMPTGEKYVRWGKARKPIVNPIKKLSFGANNVSSLKSEKYYVSKSGQVRYSIADAMQTERFSSTEERSRLNFSAKENLFENGWVSKATRQVFIGGQEYTEYSYRPVKNCLEHAVPTPQVIDAILWAVKNGTRTVFQQKRLEFGGEIGSETTKLIHTDGKTRTMTPEEEALDYTLKELSNIGVIKKENISGDGGFFRYENKYRIGKIPNAWRQLIQK